MSSSPTSSDPQPTFPLDLSAYRGRWVALIGRQVAGVGVSAEAAQLAARHSRPRERISQTLFVPPVEPDDTTSDHA
ncbi:MAG: hypothetical protein WAZ19_10335 [Anaerolineae bacterium]